MDERRLSTMDILTSGIAFAPMPEADEKPPEHYEDRAIDAGMLPSVEELSDLLRQDPPLHLDASEYYGCVHAWRRPEGGFKVTLFQYRSITEDETFETAEEAAELFSRLARACYG